MSTPYTLGTWTVKPGRAEDFIAAWTEMADWTKAEVPGARDAQLLRDISNPDRFVSFGPWDSLDAIDHWRSLEGWKQRVAKIRELLIGFEPLTLDLVLDRT